MGEAIVGMMFDRKAAMNKRLPLTSIFLAAQLALAPYFIDSNSITDAAMAANFPQWKTLLDATYGLKDRAREEQFDKALRAAKASIQTDFYPESEVLFSLGVDSFEKSRFDRAETYFESACRLKERGQSIMLTALPSPSGEMYLPAYSTKEQEIQGKIHSLANCQAWLAKSLAAANKTKAAGAAYEKALATMRSNPNNEMEMIIRPNAMLDFACVLRKLGDNNRARAIEDEARALIKKRRLLLDK